MRKRYTAEKREQFFEELRRSGDGIKVAAERVGVTAATAYAWVKRSRSVEAPKFARLVSSRPATSAVVAVQVGAATIRVEAGFDAELLCAVISALSNGSR